jgi:hypothetical protein
MQPNQPTPHRIIQTINAYQQTHVIKAAIELDVFSKIAAGNKDVASLAEACQAVESGIKRLCNALVILGFLHKENEHYSLSEESAIFLDRASPGYFGGTIEFLLAPPILEAYNLLTNAVRKGSFALDTHDSTTPEHSIWIKFARAMAPFMQHSAQIMAERLNIDPEKKIKILDIAASHGIFGISIAKKYPLAEIVAVDWPNVLAVTKENAEKSGVGDRFHMLAGSAFEIDLGKDYDIILLPNFLHHFDIATCTALLRKIHSALNDDGQVLTLEFIPNEDRVSPPMEAWFSLNMLVLTANGDAYTLNEFKKMFADAGFTNCEHFPLPPSPQHLLITTK